MSNYSQLKEFIKFSGFIILAAVIGVGFFYREEIIPYIKDIILVKPPPEHKEATAQDASKQTEKKKERKILYWTDPMIPGFKSDKPGKSPMNMDMVPVYADEEEISAGIVKVDPATVKSINVRTDKAVKSPLRRSIRTTGRIDYDERKVTHIHTKIQGWVEKLYIDFTGKEVNKGDVLLEVYAPELVTAQEEYLLALEYEKSLKDSRTEEVASGARFLLESARKRLQLFDVPEHQIKELEETRKPKKTLHIHSPTHGIVVQKNLLEGMFITPETHLYVIADISKIWVYADIYEYELPWIKVGQTAEITLTSIPGKIFRGVVSYIYPYLQAETRTVKVRMEFDNPNWELKPDMYANVKLESKIAESAILVPSEAVIRSGVRDIIIVSKGEGVFEPRDVKVGVDTGDGFLQILQGVKPGEEVVTSAQFLIDSESKLREAVEKMKGNPEDRGQSTEVRAQKSEHRSQRTEDREQKYQKPSALSERVEPTPTTEHKH